MSEHLPECPTKNCCSLCEEATTRKCICHALRACEERVIAAAVQRVEAMPDWRDSGLTYIGLFHRELVITAIKGDQP